MPEKAVGADSLVALRKQLAELTNRVVWGQLEGKQVAAELAQLASAFATAEAEADAAAPPAAAVWPRDMNEKAAPQPEWGPDQAEQKRDR